MTTFRFKLLTEINLVSLESNAQTFAELKADIADSPLAEKISFERTTEVRDGQNWTRTIKLIEKNTRAEFGSIDDARLPAGDVITFFVTPLEHKGGSGLNNTELRNIVQSLNEYSFEEVYAMLEKWDYNQLRRFGTVVKTEFKADIDLLGSRENILANILDWINEFLQKKENDCEENKQIKVEAIEEVTPLALIEMALGLLIAATDILKETEEYSSELSELHEKALELQRLLNK